MRESFGEGSGSRGTDASNGTPFLRGGVDDRADASETQEQRFSAVSRNTRNCRKHRFWNVGTTLTLRVRGTSSSCRVAEAPREECEPHSGVVWICAANHIQPKVADGEQDASYGGWTKMRRAEVGAFDEQEAALPAFPKAAYLRPEATPHDRRAQVSDRFAFNYRGADEIIADREGSLANHDAHSAEASRDSALTFEHVDDDLVHRRESACRTRSSLVAVQGTAT